MRIIDFNVHWLSSGFHICVIHHQRCYRNVQFVTLLQKVLDFWCLALSLYVEYCCHICVRASKSSLSIAERVSKCLRDLESDYFFQPKTLLHRNILVTILTILWKSFWEETFFSFNSSVTHHAMCKWSNVYHTLSIPSVGRNFLSESFIKLATSKYGLPRECFLEC